MRGDWVNANIRIAVTGSRGKSSVVRLLHEALSKSGLRTYTRVTGVIPRILTPDGEHPILRYAPANVDEMKWWLHNLPQDAQAIVLENSAVAPELQGVCPLWLKPGVTVLTNIRPDHEAYWGPHESDVLNALSNALPQNGIVVLPEELANLPQMLEIARKKSLDLQKSQSIKGMPSHLAANMGLALEACRVFDLDERTCIEAMKRMKPDLADFTILHTGNGLLAFAFSANDVVTTEELFQSTHWRREETGVLFNHRADRVDRFRTFEAWMKDNSWREVVVIGDTPPASAFRCEYYPCTENAQLTKRLNGLNWIGCGNSVYGLPLLYKLECEERGAAN